MLEARFGTWAGAGGAARATKNFTATPPAPRPRIVLIDRPQSPQSMILAGQRPAGRAAREDLLQPHRGQRGARRQLPVAHQHGSARDEGLVLRRRGSAVSCASIRSPISSHAPVQADKTGAGDPARSQQVDGFLDDKGVTDDRADPDRSTAIPASSPASSRRRRRCSARCAPTPSIDRPDNYWETIADRYRGMTSATLDTAARRVSIRANFVWVVVGDAAKVRPQLEPLGLPIEVVKPHGSAEPAPRRIAGASANRPVTGRPVPTPPSSSNRVTCPILRPGRASPLP